MKKYFLLVFAISFLAISSFAQVGINNDGTAPDPSAMLDVKSNDKGLLPPRMTHAAINAIVNPANGLIIFCADCGLDGNGAFLVFFGNRWNTLMICSSPEEATPGEHLAYNDQIVWNWNPVVGASGYKWNSTNNYGTAFDIGNQTSQTETGLACNTAYTRFVWSYNGCGISTPVMLSQTTSYTALAAPVASTHEVSETQIIWNWHQVPGTVGYKWNTVNDYNTAQSIGADTTKIETGLTCNTSYTRYIWSYDNCGPSDVAILTQSTNFSLDSPGQGTHIPGSDQIVWNWNTVQGATGYKWNTEDNFATALELGTLTSKTETGLSCNTAYSRFVWAYNNCGHSVSTPLNQTTLVSPILPTPATHVASSSQIIWNWNAVQGATGYKWNTTDNYSTAIDMGTGLTRTESDLACDSTYTRYLWAYNGCGYSTVVVLTKSTLANPTTPSQGTNTAALTSIIWRWNSVPGATGYKWGMTNNIDEAIDMGTSLMLMESGLTCNTVYNRYVWSYNDCGNSTVSTLSQSTTFNAIAAPVAGTQVASANQIVWNWNAVTNATGYKWSATNNYASATDMGTSLTKTETGLTCNTPYTRYVWAYRTCGTSTSTVLVKSTTMNPPTGITISASANPVCAGPSVTFTATPANGGTTPAYQWRLNGSNINGATNVTYAYTPVTGDKIACRLTSSLACAVNSPALSNEITMTVNPLLAASVSIAASANPVCSGTSVTFTATPTNGGTTPAYQWKVNGNSVAGATNVAYSFVPSSNNTVTCTLTSNAVCVTGSPATSNTVTMTVNPLASSPTSGIHTATQTQITWNWNTSANATGYKWNTINDFGTATDMGTTTTKTETGLTCDTAYTRYVWAYNGCGYSTPVTVTQLTSSCWVCGTSTLTINHLTTGGVAPVNKTTTYGTVTNIPGETSKCWITSNLGSTQQATSVSDATEASAGWYWQFNRKQGYKHDGSTRTPNTTWITSISENSDWLTANDPCNLELGTVWRLPTYTEWYNVDNTGGWTNWNGPWGSGLKLHAAGYLNNTNGSLANRGSGGGYWSSTQTSSVDFGRNLSFDSVVSYMNSNGKAYGFGARCLRDN